MKCYVCTIDVDPDLLNRSSYVPDGWRITPEDVVPTHYVLYNVLPEDELYVALIAIDSYKVA